MQILVGDLAKRTILCVQILMTNKFPFKLGPRVFQLLLDMFLCHHFSVINFVTAFQVGETVCATTISELFSAGAWCYHHPANLTHNWETRGGGGGHIPFCTGPKDCIVHLYHLLFFAFVLDCLLYSIFVVVFLLLFFNKFIQRTCIH